VKAGHRVQATQWPALPDDWQPIETAKPVEYIDVFLIARDTGVRCVMPAFWDGSDWRSLSILGSLIFKNPTHWQPLPAPPASA
jgi:hypothetical protein